MIPSLQIKTIEKVLLVTGGVSLSTLILQNLGLRIEAFSMGILALVCWFFASVFSGIQRNLGDPPIRQGLWTEISYNLFFMLAALQFLHYFSETTGSTMIANGNINGDWPYHWNQIQFLSQTQNFWPVNPILASEPMRYAFGINWLSALFLKVGLPMNPLIILSGLFSLWATATLLKKTFGAWGLWAFFASGGGWGLPVASVFTIWGPGSTLPWKNLAMAVYLPQRGFWWALPCGLLLLRYLIEYWSFENKRLKFPISFIFLWAVLPFFHLHTFVAISALIAATVVYQKSFFAPLKFIWGLPMALYFLNKSVSAEAAQGSVRWSWGWMTGDMGVVNSWILNAGPWLLVLVLLGLYTLTKKRERVIFLFVAGLAVLFNFLILAPWAWDQIKIVLWMYLALSFFMAKEAEQRTSPWVAAAFMVLIHFTGLLQFVGGLPSRTGSTNLWKLSDQRIIESLIRSTSPEDVILIAPQPHHPLWASGRAVVAGYEGHVWAHGVNTEGLKAALEALFNGQKIETLRFSKLSAKYLLWGPLERQWFQKDSPSEAVWKLEKSLGDYSLYSAVSASVATPN